MLLLFQSLRFLLILLFEFLINDSPLPAAAALHHHVLIILQHHSVLMVQVEQGNGAEGGGHAAGPRHRSVHRVHHGLHHGVAGGVHVVGQRVAALPQAEEGVVAARRDDPLVPAHVIEINIQGMAAAPATGETLQFCRVTAISFHSSTIAPAEPSLFTPQALHKITYFFGPPLPLVFLVALAAVLCPGVGPFSSSYPALITRLSSAMFD